MLAVLHRVQPCGTNFGPFDSEAAILLKSWPLRGQLVMSQNISAEIGPQSGAGREAALALQRLGFRILHIGTTISVQASPDVWTAAFGVSFETDAKQTLSLLPEQQTEYLKPVSSTVSIPEDLQPLISYVAFAEPPEFFA